MKYLPLIITDLKVIWFILWKIGPNNRNFYDLSIILSQNNIISDPSESNFEIIHSNLIIYSEFYFVYSQIQTIEIFQKTTIFFYSFFYIVLFIII